MVKKQSLKELFKKNKNIIINTDIDGILCGLALVKSLDCKIVGFTNSKDSVWLADKYDNLYDHVYIDMFVTNKRAICIDQHVIAIDEKHAQKIGKYGNKYNPQLDKEKFFNNRAFKTKYPFGTIHYLIAQLESEGIKVKLPKLDKELNKKYSTKFGDLILRADDAMKTTLCSKYEKNAKKWWNWLKEKEPKPSAINSMVEYLERIKKEFKDKKKLKKEIERRKEETKRFFKKEFFKEEKNYRSGDGGFKALVDNDGNITGNIEKYIRTIAKVMGIKNIKIPEHYMTHKGKAYRTRWLDFFKEDFLEKNTFYGHKIFSYAFIYAPGNDSNTNFSFTVDMK